MADYAVQGVVGNLNLANEQTTVLYPYMREVFINEAPLLMRLPRMQAAGQAYNIVANDVRPRSYTLNAACNNTDTTITLTDTTPLLVGDILELPNTTGASTERIQVSAIGNNTTATIVRAMGGTTAVTNAANNNSNLTVTLIGNSASGAEVARGTERSSRFLIPQYVQTFDFPVQVGGLANAVQNTQLPLGTSSVFSDEQRTKMVEMVRDIEYSYYYGKPTAQTSTKNATMAGLKHLIGYYAGRTTALASASNTNVKTNGGSSYTMLSFVADTIQKCIDGGGDPDVVVCSTGFMTGLFTWGYGKTQIQDPRQTELGVPINQVTYPFAGKNVTFVPSYQLGSSSNHTAIVLTSKDVLTRYIRQEFWNQRGVRGDLTEGEFIGDFAIEVGHPGWHAWVEGITSFA